MVHWSEIHVERLKRISPADFAERELYVVTDAELGPSYRHGSALAWVCAAGGKRFRSHLERIGLWRGDGDVIAVCDSWFQLERSRADGVLIHELGHVVDNRGLEAVVSDEGIELTLQKDQAKVALGDPVFVDDSGPAPKWSGHGLSWIRAVIHLICRAGVSQWHVNFADEGYGLSDRVEYIKALGDEPRRLESLPVAEILKQPAPAAFTELFERDTKPVAVAG